MTQEVTLSGVKATGCHLSECRDYTEGHAECGNCPPVPSFEELDDPYGTEDGETGWFLKSERTPDRSSAKRRALSDLDWCCEWIDLRVRTIWMQPYYRSWDYGMSWGVRKCAKDDPFSLEFWEVTA